MDKAHAWLNQASVGTMWCHIVGFCLTIWQNYIRIQRRWCSNYLKRVSLFFLCIPMLNHLSAFRVEANTEFIRSKTLQRRSSFKWTHKKYLWVCLGVWQHISQPPILWLNAEHPWGDGFGSLQNGKSIFAEGVIEGLGGEKVLCWEKKNVLVWLFRVQSFAYLFAASLFTWRIGKTWIGRYL